jgi:hypothetical protein
MFEDGVRGSEVPFVVFMKRAYWKSNARKSG